MGPKLRLKAIATRMVQKTLRELKMLSFDIIFEQKKIFDEKSCFKNLHMASKVELSIGSHVPKFKESVSRKGKP
jgi:hypothetical protein